MPKTSFNAPSNHSSATPSQTSTTSKSSSRKNKESTQSSSGVQSMQGYSNTLSGSDKNELSDPEFYKQQIIQWLKSMDTDERFEVFLIRDRWFAQTIVKMFWKQKLGGNSAFALYTEEDKIQRTINSRTTINELEQQFYCRRCVDHESTSASSRARKKAEQEIISSVRVIDDKEYYDSLGFDKNFLESSIELLIGAFDVISNFNLFSTSHLSHFSWFNPKAFQTFAAWIVSQFEKILQQKFLEDQFKLNSKTARMAVTMEKQHLLSSFEDNLQSHNNKFQSEIMNHYENLLRFWKSLSVVKKKKVLSTCCEIRKSLNEQTISASNNKNTSNELEWFCKVRDTFYNTKDTNNNANNLGNTQCILLSTYPSDEQLRVEMQQYSEDSKSEIFISQLCFPGLEHTSMITTLILKQIHLKLKQMYSEDIVENLIRHEELDKKKKKQQSNNNQPQQHLIAVSQGIAGLAQKKKKKQHHNIFNMNQKKNKGVIGSINNNNTSIITVNGNGSVANSNSVMKNTINSKNNCKLNSIEQSQLKEKSFAEEVSLLYQEELKEEKRQEDLSILGSTAKEFNKNIPSLDENNLKEQLTQGYTLKANETAGNSRKHNNVKDQRYCNGIDKGQLKLSNKELAGSNQNTDKSIQSNKLNGNTIQNTTFNTVTDVTSHAMECCDFANCELSEMSKTIAMNLIQQCISGFDQIDDLDENSDHQKGTQVNQGKDRNNQNGLKNKLDSHDTKESIEKDTNSKNKKKGKKQKTQQHNGINNTEESVEPTVAVTLGQDGLSSLSQPAKLQNQQHNQTLPSPSSTESSQITAHQLTEETDDNDVINTATTFDNIVQKHTNDQNQNLVTKQKQQVIIKQDTNDSKLCETNMKNNEKIIKEDIHKNPKNDVGSEVINKGKQQQQQLGSLNNHLEKSDMLNNKQEHDHDEEGFIQVKNKKNNRLQQLKSQQSVTDKNNHSKQKGKNNNNSGNSMNSNADKNNNNIKQNNSINQKNKQKNQVENTHNKNNGDRIITSQVTTHVQVENQENTYDSSSSQINNSTVTNNNMSSTLIQANDKSNAVIQPSLSLKQQLPSKTPLFQSQDQDQQQQHISVQNHNKIGTNSETSFNHLASLVNEKQTQQTPTGMLFNQNSNTKNDDPDIISQQDTSFNQTHKISSQLQSQSSSTTPQQDLSKQFQQQSSPNLTYSLQPIQSTFVPARIKTKIAKRLFKKKITHDIIQLSEQINTESNYHQPSRHLIFLRIQHVLKTLYAAKDVDLRIFGSCATGLSLPTSDIDIGITGFERSSKLELIGVLGNLVDALERFSWVKAVERIFTASVPIVKIEIDPLIEFSAMKDLNSSENHRLLFEVPNSETKFNLPQHISFDDTVKQNYLHGMHLKVDISVESQVQTPQSSPYLERFQHIGVLSTDFVTRWMSYYTGIQPMMILMKSFLYARNLNTNYKGGISSYCLLIMIIAFFRDNHALAQSNDYSSILMDFLKFYGSQFNPENTGISLINQKPFFKVIPCPGQSKLQVIEPLMGKVITQNTYLIDEIQKEFEGFHTRLVEFSRKCEKYLQKLNAQELQLIDSVSYQELLNKIEWQKEQQNQPLQRAFHELREFLLPNLIEAAIYQVDSFKYQDFDKAFKEHKQQCNYVGIQDFNSINSNRNTERNEDINQKLPNKSRKSKETLNNNS